MNTIEIVRGSNGKIKSASLDGQPLKAQSIIVTDSITDGAGGASEVTIIMQAIIKGHTE